MPRRYRIQGKHHLFRDDEAGDVCLFADADKEISKIQEQAAIERFNFQNRITGLDRELEVASRLIAELKESNVKLGVKYNEIFDMVAEIAWTISPVYRYVG